MTEKKKRFPKPQKGITLDYLLSNGLPFLNAKDKDEIILSVQGFIEELAKTETGEHLYPVTLIGWDDKYSHKFFSLPETRESLMKAQTAAQLLIKSASLPGFIKDVQDMAWSRYMEPLEPVYNRFFSKEGRTIPDFKIGAKGRKGIKDQDSFNEVWVKALPAIIICLTISAIKDGAYQVIEKGHNSETRYLKSAAVAFLGMCPRCGTIFEKKQSNAEFCSKRCGNADRQESFRKK